VYIRHIYHVEYINTKKGVCFNLVLKHRSDEGMFLSEIDNGPPVKIGIKRRGEVELVCIS
jgi:hypothetical protein